MFKAIAKKLYYWGAFKTRIGLAPNERYFRTRRNGTLQAAKRTFAAFETYFRQQPDYQWVTEVKLLINAVP